MSSEYNNAPYKNIPDELKDKYTMNDKIPIKNMYLDNKSSDIVEWTNELIADYMKNYQPWKIKRNLVRGVPYGKKNNKKHLISFLNAINKYNIINKNIAVVGSSLPWIESIFLHYDNNVTTVEYLVPKCNHPKLKCINYFSDFKTTSNLYDCIITYSSIEHSGLGRYGDPLDPDGDIKTMTDIHKNLKNDGILIWGAPVGKDTLVWNAHRIYGSIRLPLLFKNFEELEWDYDKETIINSLNDKATIQPVIILKKM
jgi:hypothetical protein